MSTQNGQKKSSLINFLIAYGLTLGAGLIAGLFSMNAKTIYDSIAMPAFAPPASIFMPVWIILYILMGTAFFIVLQKGGGTNSRKNAVTYYIIALVFNVLWSLLFFSFNLRAAAFIDIIILLIYIIITDVRFLRINKAAGILMLIYLAWTVFASVLNFSILMLNG